MSDAGDRQAQGGGRFVVWAGLCGVAAGFWIERGARDDRPAAPELAKASCELGHSSRRYLALRVTGRDAIDLRPVYEKLVPDRRTRIAKAQPVNLAARRESR